MKEKKYPICIEKKEFGMKKQIKYSLWFLFLVLLFAACFSLVDPMNKGSIIPFIFICFFVIIVFLLPLLYSYYYKIKMDETGLFIRKLFKKEFYSWDDFSNCKLMRKRDDFEFLFKKAGQGSRKLNFYYLNETNKEILYDICLSLIKKEEPKEVIEDIIITSPMLKNIFSLKKELRFSQKEILCKENLIYKEFNWYDVSNVKIYKSHHNNPFFYIIKISLPDREIGYTYGYGEKWKFNKDKMASEILGLVEKYVSKNKIEIYSLKGTPETTKEIDYRISVSQESFYKYKKSLFYFFILMSLFLLILLYITHLKSNIPMKQIIQMLQNKHNLIQGVLTIIFLFGSFLYVKIFIKRKIHELNEYKKKLASEQTVNSKEENQ